MLCGAGAAIAAVPVMKLAPKAEAESVPADPRGVAEYKDYLDYFVFSPDGSLKGTIQTDDLDQLSQVRWCNGEPFVLEGDVIVPVPPRGEISAYHYAATGHHWEGLERGQV